MEFLKFRCKSVGPCCQSCCAWNGPEMESIPQPVPDVNNPGHYMDVFVTPKVEDGIERKADDWQPRANITKCFNSNQLSLKDEHKIAVFADKFGVKKEYVVSYIQHLINLSLTREIRSRERERQRVQKKSKTYEEYDWLEMAMDGKLSNLTIPELDKYLDKNELTKKGDKIRAIVADVLRKSSGERIEEVRKTTTVEDDRSDGDEDSSSDDSDGDVVIEEIGSDSEESNDEHEVDEHDHDVLNTDEEEETVPLVVTTRYGRHAGSWNLFQLK